MGLLIIACDAPTALRALDRHPDTLVDRTVLAILHEANADDRTAGIADVRVSLSAVMDTKR